MLYNNGSVLQQLAANDDSSGLASQVIFTAPYTDYYAIWVRAYATGTGGSADVAINGSTVLTQAQFGGNMHWTTGTWDAGDQFRVAPTRFTGNGDSMIFLLRGNVDFVQMDDEAVHSSVLSRRHRPPRGLASRHGPFTACIQGPRPQTTDVFSSRLHRTAPTTPTATV